MMNRSHHQKSRIKPDIGEHNRKGRMWQTQLVRDQVKNDMANMRTTEEHVKNRGRVGSPGVRSSTITGIHGHGIRSTSK